MSLARNTGINIGSAVLLIGVALVTVPLYLKLVGLERYGVLSVCWLLLGYLGLFDLGLGRAVTQGIANLPADDDAGANRIFWTGLCTSGCMAVGAFLIALPVGYLAMHAISFEDARLASEATRAVPWIACAVPVNMLAGIYTGALIGRSRFGTVGIIDIGSSVTATVAPLAVAAFVSPDLPGLVAASVTARIVAAIGAACAAYRIVPIGRARRPSRTLLKSMLSFGGWVSLSNIVGPLLSMWDRFIIGVVLGPRAVSIYVIPFSIMMRMLIVPEGLNRALFPRLAGMDRDEATRLCVTSVGFVSLLMTPAMLFALLAVYPFFEVWVGPGLAPDAARIAYLLVPGIWANALALIAFALLHAQRRASVPALLHAAEVVPYISLLWLALGRWGVLGAAGLWSIRAIVDAWTMFFLSPVGIGPLTPVCWCFAIIVAATVAAEGLPLGGTSQLACLSLAFCAGTVAAYRTSPDDAKARLRSAMSMLHRRPA